MAGYMRKLNGYVYDGAHVAAEALENGVFAEITSTGVKKIAAAKDTVLRVAEKTTLWGMEALVLDVVSAGSAEVFLVENEWDIRDTEEYDTAKYTCKVGDYVKMRRPAIGDQQIVTVAKTLYNSLSVGDTVKPTTGGTVAKAS